ncbi:hypothetical protein LCGC14_1684020 [marine sediment metagenome]|uniref:Deoxynucleoside monophosphate kinase n=1 Tax=marine sediment metagenome TaxID=412755 RepID=A0A0F9KMT7_9ZZZZ
MDTIIIGVSGKKQSGKNTLCDFLKTFIPKNWNARLIKEYSLVDALKEKVCIDVMGLTKKQCYGSNKEKDSFTSYKWENLPDQIRYANALETEKIRDGGHPGQFCDIPVLRKGRMTAREIMQVVATDVFRRYFDNDIWISATLRKIKQEQSSIALISDVRFPGEVKRIIKKGGHIIRLLRDVCEIDPHESETVLDDFDFEGTENCLVLDNKKMSVDQQNAATIPIIDDILSKVIV